VQSVAERLETVATSLAQAAERAGRSSASITLVAVSKKQSIESMRAYAAVANARGIPIVFGESYVQEFKAKRHELGDLGQFHLIGPLQSNKIRDAVRYADVIESVHSRKVFDVIAKEASALGKRQSIFLQVNIGKDPNKSGFSADEIPEICQVATRLSQHVCLLGLMTITPYYEVAEDSRGDFRAMNELRERLIASGADQYFENRTIALSMGMSSDFEIAIEEGADLVRVGTALFGER